MKNRKNAVLRAALLLTSAGLLAGWGTGCSSPSSTSSETTTSSRAALTGPAWQAGTTYGTVGELVSYDGKVYRLLQPHTALTGWEPPNVAALWALEGVDDGGVGGSGGGPSGPTEALSFDYVTLEVDCDGDPGACCELGSTPVDLTSGDDTHYSLSPNQCILAGQGRDTVFLQSSGPSSLILGGGDDTAMDGAADDFIWGGPGNDTINGYGGTNLFFGSWGNDIIHAANGENRVVPGPGLDLISLGTGNDTVHIFDLCEIEPGETLDGGTGTDTLYAPVPLEELQALGLVISNFERFFVRDDRCRSQCSDHQGCSYCGDDDDGDGVGNCSDGCPLDPNKTEIGFCGCGEEENDQDGDGFPACIEECDEDASTTTRGQCGCAPDVAPAGTECNDGIAPGTFTCDGAGNCGDPMTDAPEAGCFWKTFRGRVYWFCSGPASQDEAEALCAASPGRHLVQISSRLENLVVSKFTSSPSFIGATDATTEGEWSWLDAAGEERYQFWTGGAAGQRYKGYFSAFAGGKPSDDDAADCATIDETGQWHVTGCGSAAGYVCEGPFGPTRNPGNGVGHDPKDFGDVFPGWSSSSNGAGNSTTGVCEPAPTGSDLEQAVAEADLCATECGPESSRTEEDCEANYCKGAAEAPPPGTCEDPLDPLSELHFISVGTCSVDDPETTADEEDCSDVTILGLPTKCGVRTRCLQVEQNGSGDWVTFDCENGNDCGAGQYCDSTLQKCVNPSFASACDPGVVDAEGVCHGSCFSDVGCGVDEKTFFDLLPWVSGGSAEDRCGEVEYCSDEGAYTGGLEEPGSLDPTEFDPSVLPDHSEDLPPGYSTDFDSPCGASSCTGCAENAGPSCDRAERHPWCNSDAEAPGAPEAAAGDDREGSRGNGSSIVKFNVDPGADLYFNVDPLPFGVPRFDVKASASVRADVGFKLGKISGDIEIIDLRGELAASLCRVTTKNSRLEVLGVDFLPTIASSSGALFDTNDDWAGAEDCQAAVDTYVDTVDRVKKALRDAQELIRQYDELRAQGETFAENFCETVAGAGLRPPGMPRANWTDPCLNQTPEDVINDFIQYYHDQARYKIAEALGDLADKALDSDALGSLLGQGADQGFSFYVPIGEAFKGEESATIINLNFFVGPIPANLEVAAYMNYGIKGGFAATLSPAVLISGGGEFARAGAIVTPYADSGVTLFVGVGFDYGPFSLKLGIEGGITLARVELPATAAAGLAMEPEVEDPELRPLPIDLEAVSTGEVLYPPLGGLQKYNFQFTYDYGVDLTLSDMLSGFIAGKVKVKFAFFSKTWKKRLIEFDSGLSFGPYTLVGGSGGSAVAGGFPQVWKSSYNSVPFVKLDPLEHPAPDEVLQPAASFDNTNASALFYDTLCTCSEEGTECNRNADCCDDSNVCFSDPGQGGQGVCSTCRKWESFSSNNPNHNPADEEHETCNTVEDCCGTKAKCSRDAIPTSCTWVPPSPTCTGLCFGEWNCVMETPTTSVCQYDPEKDAPL